ncbi:molybdenum cofactor guanylyltransferase [Aquibacillus saliphilus]|uniref:molybdenum cofactor guanylyltransferase n=1 Tax=Aquibacillus saliphilus TaxID=1909422 RepID=UPI001CEFFB01
MPFSYVGIVIAGGKSRRFGSPKAFAKLEGKPLYSYSLSVLNKYCSSVILVTSSSLEYSFKQENLPVQVIQDNIKYQGEGPLAGIYSAMVKVKKDWYIVLPIDVPFMQEWVIKELINQIDCYCDAVVPIVNGKRQPLVALYHYRLKDKIEDSLKQGKRSFDELLDTANVKYISNIKDEKPFININRQEDFPE